MPLPTTVEGFVDGVLARDRTVLARAVTLVESTRDDHRAMADELLQALLPHTGRAHRIGVTGVPGVGKSTFIETLGTWLLDRDHRVAVLTIDPTSRRTGGSILGDKTRMQRLAVADDAFVRPSPSAGTLGGVARRTRETMLVCEAAGFDVVLVETVGVGQSEVTVRDMVDVFLVLALPNAGDTLQGIKKGVLELADVIAVNKADGEMRRAAERARNELRQALHMLAPTSPHWSPEVVMMSALEADGIDGLWDVLERHREALTSSGELEEQRRQQLVTWMWSQIEDRLLASLRAHPGVRGLLPEVERAVVAGELTSGRAADQVLDAYARRDD
ncbi:methylmalonyl Co-A mutase-associated GTPase MeaB [Nitriliruptoraceae bacterium ZYF776]|nr:methylmalonyl Co-A mutase-associated GTPase MeaB [Profundirhabdus halotolerans]